MSLVAAALRHKINEQGASTDVSCSYTIIKIAQETASIACSTRPWLARTVYQQRMFASPDLPSGAATLSQPLNSVFLCLSLVIMIAVDHARCCVRICGCPACRLGEVQFVSGEVLKSQSVSNATGFLFVLQLEASLVPAAESLGVSVPAGHGLFSDTATLLNRAEQTQATLTAEVQQELHRWRSTKLKAARRYVHRCTQDQDTDIEGEG